MSEGHDALLGAQVRALALVRRAGRALVVVPLLLALVLLLTAVLAGRRVEEGLDAARRGEGSALLHVVSQRTHEGADRDALAALVVAHAADGLRCVAVFEPGLEDVASAGTCRGATANELRRLRPDEVARDGEVWRMAAHLRPPGRGPGPPERGPRRTGPAGPHGSGPPPQGPRPILIEFAPVRTHALDASARLLLGLAVAGAAALGTTAAGLGVLTARASRVQEQLARSRRLAAMGEMSAVMAHEIRNPLASLKGHAQLLVEKLDAGTGVQAKAERLVTEVVRLERLTEDLLDLARADHVVRAPADPARLLREAADAAGGDVRITDEAAPPRWSVDAARLRQVLVNVLRNAVQAGGGVPVEASVAMESARLVYRVRDRGPGVPEAERDRVFEPFHTTRVRGTGLGLAVARRIVEAHGGSIDIGTHPAGGAEVRVVLP